MDMFDFGCVQTSPPPKKPKLTHEQASMITIYLMIFTISKLSRNREKNTTHKL